MPKHFSDGKSGKDAARQNRYLSEIWIFLCSRTPGNSGSDSDCSFRQEGRPGWLYRKRKDCQCLAGYGSVFGYNPEQPVLCQ